jgi:hypothetical protein
MADGWGYIKGRGPVYMPDAGRVRAELQDDKYGQELDEYAASLDELEDAVRRDWAAKLRQMASNGAHPGDLVSALDPDLSDGEPGHGLARDYR